MTDSHSASVAGDIRVISVGRVAVRVRMRPSLWSTIVRPMRIVLGRRANDCGIVPRQSLSRPAHQALWALGRSLGLGFPLDHHDNVVRDRLAVGSERLGLSRVVRGMARGLNASDGRRQEGEKAP